MRKRRGGAARAAACTAARASRLAWPPAAPVALALLALLQASGCHAQRPFPDYVLYYEGSASSYPSAAPAYARPGAPITLTAQVWNIGSEAGGAADLVVIQTPTEATPFAPQCGDDISFLATTIVKVPPLGPKQAVTLRVPGLTAADGPSSLLLWLPGECGTPGYDGLHDFAVAFSGVVSAPKPDFVVSSAQVGGTSLPWAYVLAAGDGAEGAAAHTYSLTVTVKNIGTAAAAPGYVRVRPAPGNDSDPGTCTPLTPGDGGQEAFLGRLLAPGRTTIVTFAGLPEPDSDTRIWVSVDAGCKTDEANEDNNSLALSLLASQHPTAPSFYVTKVAWVPPRPRAGSLAKALVTIANVGAAAGAPGLVGLNPNNIDFPTFTTPSNGGGGQPPALGSVAGAPGGPGPCQEGRNLNFTSAPVAAPVPPLGSVTVVVPNVRMPARRGTYQLAVRVDPGCQVEEGDRPQGQGQGFVYTVF